MNNQWNLPASLSIGGVGYPIRTDFRDVLKILKVLSDPDYLPETKAIVCVKGLFKDEIPPEHFEEALTAAYAFIDGAIGEREDNKKPKPTLMDWEQDAALIIPAINKVLGQEVRANPCSPRRPLNTN